MDADPARLSRLGAGAVLVLAVALRSAFFLVFDESYFDSDQAIVGLMAKHLAEGRAFPLFFYGQEYMLAVESWVMAPVFALLGPTVFALRLTIVLLNLATAGLLWWLLMRDAALGPWSALLAASPFVLAPFITGAHLVEAQGGNIEQFLWVLVAWAVRRRPLWLGAILGLAFLNREFTVYAVPALLVVQGVEQRGRLRALIRPWSATAAAFAVVFLVVMGLRPHADLMGPGTAGQPVSEGRANVVTLLLERINVDPFALPVRARALAIEHLPMLVGLVGYRPYLLSIGSDAHIGWDELGWPVLLMVSGVLVWTAREVTRGHSLATSGLPLFLALVGLQSAAGYGLSHAVGMLTFRYGLLALLLPVALAAAALNRRRPAALRGLAAATCGLLCAASLVDHVLVLQRSSFAPPRPRFVPLVERLDQRGITLARAGYWRAYVVAFLSSERVRVASTDFKRIREYEEAVARGGDQVVDIREAPCPEGRTVDEVRPWYLCR